MLVLIAARPITIALILVSNWDDKTYQNPNYHNVHLVISLLAFLSNTLKALWIPVTTMTTRDNRFSQAPENDYMVDRTSLATEHLPTHSSHVDRAGQSCSRKTTRQPGIGR